MNLKVVLPLYFRLLSSLFLVFSLFPFPVTKSVFTTRPFVVVVQHP